MPLIPPLTEHWRRAFGPTLMDNPPEVLADLAVVADLGGVRAVALQDGEPRWNWRLMSLGERAPGDLKVRWIRAVGEVLVVAAVGAGEVWLVGLGPDGARRWVSSRLGDTVEQGATVDGHLVVSTVRGVKPELLLLDPIHGRATLELLPPGLTDPVRCASGWCFHAGSDFPGGPGVAWRPDEGQAVTVWPVGVPVAVHAVGDVVAVITSVTGQRQHQMSVWSAPAGRELWRRPDVFWQVAASERGVLHLDRPDGAWRPRRAELLTGQECWAGEPLRRDALPIDAGEVAVFAASFEVRLLASDTGIVLQTIPVPRGLSGRKPRMVAGGRLHVVTERSVLAYA